MPNVIYINRDGIKQTFDIAIGDSVMAGAIENNVKGIEADCGGACACATCHVYVAEQDLVRLVEPDDVEMEMLSGVAAERRSNSRLSCQIRMTQQLEGLVVQIPEKQT